MTVVHDELVVAEPAAPERLTDRVDRFVDGFARLRLSTLPERLRIPPPKGRPAPWAVLVTWTLRAAAALTAWVLVYAFVLSGLQEHRAQATAYEHFRENLALATVPISGPIKTGEPVAMLSAPVIGMKNLVVVEGTSSDTLRDGPGHRRDTPLPGQPGYSVLYGRSVTYGAPFGEIHRFEPGDLIAVTTGEGQFNFKVDDVRKAGDPLPPALAAGGSRLVLETSNGSSWRSGFGPGHALYVDATLTGAVAGGGQVAALRAHESAMDSDTGGLTALVLWLEAMVLAVLGVVWMAARWGRWQTWLVGGPMVLLVLWGATNAAAPLLPNLV